MQTAQNKLLAGSFLYRRLSKGDSEDEYSQFKDPEHTVESIMAEEFEPHAQMMRQFDTELTAPKDLALAEREGEPGHRPFGIFALPNGTTQNFGDIIWENTSEYNCRGITLNPVTYDVEEATYLPDVANEETRVMARRLALLSNLKVLGVYAGSHSGLASCFFEGEMYACNNSGVQINTHDSLYALPAIGLGSDDYPEIKLIPVPINKGDLWTSVSTLAWLVQNEGLDDVDRSALQCFENDGHFQHDGDKALQTYMQMGLLYSSVRHVLQPNRVDESSLYFYIETLLHNLKLGVATNDANVGELVKYKLTVGR